MPEEGFSFFFNDEKCRDIIEKFLSVALPVKVSPSVDIKPISVETCGKPIITSGRHPRCEMGNKKGDCEFTIIQKMKLEIPVQFMIKTDIEDPYVDCEVKKDDDRD